LLALARDFKLAGHEVHVLFYFPHFYYAGFLRNHDIPYRFIPEKSVLGRLVKMRRAIRKLNPDGVIAFLPPAAVIAEFASLPFRSWSLIVGERGAPPRMVKDPRAVLMRLTHLLADYVVSNSAANMALVKRANPFLPSRRLRLIYNSLDLSEFSPDPSYEYKRSGVLSIIVPATYRRLKNILRLIEAVIMLPDSYKARLQISWFGEKRYDTHQDNVLRDAEELIESSGLQGVFVLNDLDPDMGVRMRQFDAVGLFSEYEGLPNAICEGMACGKPIVASAVGDLGLFIKPSVNGFLCDPYDVESISAALCSLIDATCDQLREMGGRNREFAEENFDKNCIRRQYLELLQG
jgi:glycosyltransferase involved in cell wall biosynthesis